MRPIRKLIFMGILVFSLFNLSISENGISTDTKSVFAQQDNSVSNSVWTDKADIVINDITKVIPQKYRYLNLNLNSFRNIMTAAPFEFTDRAVASPLIIELPHPDGGMSKFYVTEYSMMEQGLADQYPDMKTYNVKGIDDPYAVGKIDFTAFGFHAIVLTPNGDYFIDPLSMDNTENYISYFKSDYFSNQTFECLVTEVTENTELINSHNSDMTGQQLRTYRLACAATGEYTAFHGGTVALGLAGIVTAINRVNQVYERDLSVRMTLVANNNLIVYTNSGTDPYTNNNGVTMLGQNQTNCNAVIGSANYDIGHVFSTGGGGVAGLSVVCVNASKARGVTGLPSPIGDPFYIDYVAHEMGHQFGGNHTFNGSSGNCAGGNRNGSTAWEPGSGSTIQAYAGICSPQDLQSNSDDYFHTGSVSEMTAFTQTGNGNSCPVTTNTGNTPPTVTVPSGGFTIPISTPFELTGSATDTETPGSLTYCWEEFDLGAAGAPNSPVGNAPIFRSFNPVVSPTRTFPKLSNLLNNTSTIGEILPTYTRSLTFRLTARDNSAGGGGINFSTVAFSVNNSSGPFLVTSPNTGVSWNAGAQTVTWNVANTTAAPVNCANVDILLSTDGGNTFPTTILSNTPNDGSQSVTIPNTATATARIKVKAKGNIFFDISNTNFTIVGGPSVPPCEDFTSGTFPPPPLTIDFTGTNRWSRNTVSAYGIGTGSAKFDFYNAQFNENQSIVSDNFVATLSGDYLTFDEAYAPYTDANFGPDTLLVEASSNSGGSYTTLATLIGRQDGTGELNTAPPNVNAYTPTNSEWASKIYALPAGTNKIRLKAKSGYGNNLYIDNLCVKTLPNATIAGIGNTPQGFYRGTPGIYSGIPDSVNIYLHRTDFPNIKVDSAFITLSNSCETFPTFSKALSGDYYIVVKHRNSIETWSRSGGEAYTRGGFFYFDFLEVNYAYNNNQFQINSTNNLWGMYGGDCNQDGVIEIADLSIIDNDAFNFAGGYIVSDVNGDNFADINDYAIADNNAFNIVTIQAPPGSAPPPAEDKNINPVFKSDAERNKYEMSLRISKENNVKREVKQVSTSELNEVLKQRSERDKLRTTPLSKNSEVKINSVNRTQVRRK